MTAPEPEIHWSATGSAAGEARYGNFTASVYGCGPVGGGDLPEWVIWPIGGEGVIYPVRHGTADTIEQAKIDAATALREVARGTATREG